MKENSFLINKTEIITIDFKSEKLLLAYWEKVKNKVKMFKRGKVAIFGNCRFLKKVDSFKQVDYYSEDSYYYYDKDWDNYTLVLIRVYF